MKKIIIFIFTVGYTVLSLYSEAASIEKPCPSDAPMKRTGRSLLGKFEECLSCETGQLQISPEECAKCGDTRSAVHGLCLFRKSIHKDRPLIGPDYGWTDGGGVRIIEFGCDIEKPLLTTRSNCDECPERIYKNGYCYSKKFLEEDCPPDQPLKTGGGCASCYVVDDVMTPTEKDCLVCSNRTVVREEGNGSFKCVLEACPSDRPLKTLYWGCRRCDEDYHVFTATEADCNVCSNRKATPSGKEFNCIIETCPAERPLKFSLLNAGCIGCDGRLKDSDTTFWRIEVDTEEECLACPNREVVKHGDRIYCDLPSTCPPDKPMRTNNTGTCIACDDPNAIDIVPETECLKCPELRVWEPDRYCRFRKSPDPARPLIGAWGNEVIFEPCDTLNRDVFTTKENCALCPNREYVDGGCKLKESK